MRLPIELPIWQPMWSPIPDANQAGGGEVIPEPEPSLVMFSDSFASGVDGVDLSARSGWTKVDGGRASQTTGASSIRHVAGSAPDSAYVGPDLLSPKHFVQGTWLTITNSTTFGIAGRMVDGQNYVGIRRNSGNQWQLFKNVAGAFTQLGSLSQAMTVGDVLRMEFDGDGVTCYLNGVVFLGTGAVSLGGSLPTATRCGHAVRASLAPLISDFSCGAMA